MSRKKELISQDFVTSPPDPILFVDEDQIAVADEHKIIVRALKEKPLTPKEIHGLFFEEESKKYGYSLKTVYRHIERLVSAGLIKIAGHRMYERSHITERLYSRTATVFFPKPEQDETPSDEIQQAELEFSNKIRLLLASALNRSSMPEKKQFASKFGRISDGIYKVMVQILKNTSEDKDLADLFAETDMDETNKMMTYAGFLYLLVRNDKAITGFQKLYE